MRPVVRLSAVFRMLALVDISLPAGMVEDAFRAGPEGLLPTDCQGGFWLAVSPGGKGSSGWAGDQAAKGLALTKPLVAWELSHCCCSGSCLAETLLADSLLACSAKHGGHVVRDMCLIAAWHALSAQWHTDRQRKCGTTYCLRILSCVEGMMTSHSISKRSDARQL